ncbi:hypothetical protein EV360DRAFT_90886 [Lentinula raphanica]|nr:hypothetical protein EV360DRAFT_90886 [Lentinula raphanica]
MSFLMKTILDLVSVAILSPYMGNQCDSVRDGNFHPLRTLCENCQLPYIQHRSSSTSHTESLVSPDGGPSTQPSSAAPSQATAIPWSGHRIAGYRRFDHQNERNHTSSQNRVNAGVAPSPFTRMLPIGTSSQGPGISRPSVFDVAPISARSKPGRGSRLIGPGKIEINLRIIVNCIPDTQYFNDMEFPEPYFQGGDIRAPVSEKQQMMVDRALQLGLTFLMKGEVNRSQRAYPDIDLRLKDLMIKKNLEFVDRKGERMTFTDDIATWTILICRQTSRTGGQPVLRPAIQPWGLTYQEIVRSARRYSALQGRDDNSELLVLICKSPK